MLTSSALVRLLPCSDLIHILYLRVASLDPNIKTAYAKEKWQASFTKLGSSASSSGEMILLFVDAMLTLPV